LKFETRNYNSQISNLIKNLILQNGFVVKKIQVLSKNYELPKVFLTKKAQKHHKNSNFFVMKKFLFLFKNKNSKQFLMHLLFSSLNTKLN